MLIGHTKIRRREGSGLRLFVALRPPQAALDELAVAVSRLRAPAPAGLRWTAPEQWHLTLLFLDEVPEAVVPGLTRGLTRAAAAVGPLQLALAGGGRFGDRVLWVGRSGDVPAARALAKKVRHEAHGAGLEVEQRSWLPHLTLARGARPVTLAPAAQALSGFAGTIWQADSVELVQNTLGAGPGGTAQHRGIARFALGG